MQLRKIGFIGMGVQGKHVDCCALCLWETYGAIPNFLDVVNR